MAPTLPPLYFDGKSANDGSFLATVPAEIVQNVTSFFDWGDLSRLTAIHRAWQNVVSDAANTHESQWELAQALLDGTHGLMCHPERAVKLMKELAGVVMMKESVIASDEHEQSERVVTKALPSSSPFAPAMRRLADCHLKGEGVAKDTTAGIRWLEAAFDHGLDMDAAHELALLYEYGEHEVPIDVYLAAEWFHKAAEAGHVEAMSEYAMCCELGCGVDQSDDLALEWYMKAANAGHVTAKYSVGECFEEARGVPQSDEEACLWYYKAAVEGDEDSKKALRRLRDIARIVVPGVAVLLDG
jgi:TPR repeat protein